jgi:hypothetical protein
MIFVELPGKREGERYRLDPEKIAYLHNHSDDLTCVGLVSGQTIQVLGSLGDVADAIQAPPKA